MRRQQVQGVPSQLYAVQQPAFESAAAYSPKVTDSTPDSPPSFTPADLSQACETKTNIVNNLPTQCAHCATSFEGVTGCLTEMSNGTIMAYCKGKGGCGRSQVLFVPPDTTVPKYKKVCVFEAEPGHPSLDDITYSMHAMMPQIAPCRKCRKNYQEHERGYDSNGWLEYVSILCTTMLNTKY
jgi:hypothetical protein